MRGFQLFFEQALLRSGGAEPRDHGLERRTSLEWGHGGHRVGPVFFEIGIPGPAAWFSMHFLSRLPSQVVVQNQETMDLNVGPALNGDMVATAVVKFSLKFESLEPLVCN